MSFSGEPQVPRQIVAFRTDDEGHWVAVLSCGHTQHIRHDPPWRNHAWVTTDAGRARFLGTEVGCVACARPDA